MRIKSKAGTFIMTVDEVDAESDEMIMTGKMGVWQAKTHVNVDELMEMVSAVKVKYKVIDFLALFGFRYLRNLLENEGKGPAEGEKT